MGTGLGRWGVALLVGALVFTAAPAASAHDVLPDLGMAKIVDLQQTKFSDGRIVLRYSTTVVNVGAGAFEVRGTRTSPSEMSQSQRIFDSTGSFRDVATAGTMVFGGDGHNHWHVNNLASTELLALNGNRVGTSNKRGFCFWDNIKYRLTLLGAPRNAFYQAAGCGTLDSNAVTMGLSVGWADKYAASLPDQLIDISSLAPGRYRLQITADLQDWFAETDETNNTTWVDLQLRNSGQPKVLGYGPVA